MLTAIKVEECDIASFIVKDLGASAENASDLSQAFKEVNKVRHLP